MIGRYAQISRQHVVQQQQQYPNIQTYLFLESAVCMHIFYEQHVVCGGYGDTAAPCKKTMVPHHISSAAVCCCDIYIYITVVVATHKQVRAHACVCLVLRTHQVLLLYFVSSYIIRRIILHALHISLCSCSSVGITI